MQKESDNFWKNQADIPNDTSRTHMTKQEKYLFGQGNATPASGLAANDQVNFRQRRVGTAQLNKRRKPPGDLSGFRSKKQSAY